MGLSRVSTVAFDDVGDGILAQPHFAPDQAVDASRGHEPSPLRQAGRISACGLAVAATRKAARLAAICRLRALKGDPRCWCIAASSPPIPCDLAQKGRKRPPPSVVRSNRIIAIN